MTATQNTRQTWNDIAYEHTNRPWHSWPAHVDQLHFPARLMWGSDFVAHITTVKSDSLTERNRLAGQVRVTVWNGNVYQGPATRVIPLALDDYLDERMQMRTPQEASELPVGGKDWI